MFTPHLPKGGLYLYKISKSREADVLPGVYFLKLSELSQFIAGLNTCNASDNAATNDCRADHI